MAQTSQTVRLRQRADGGPGVDALTPTEIGAHNVIEVIVTLDGVTAPALNAIWEPVDIASAVSSYTPEVGLAVPSPVATEGPPLPLFPLVANVPLSCEAQSPFDELWYPCADVLRAAWPGQPLTSNPPVGPIGVRVEDGQFWLRFGERDVNPGFALEAEFAPAFPGYLGLLQLLNGSSWYDMEDGTKLTVSDTKGGWMLDYLSTDFDFLVAPPVYCTAAAPGVIPFFTDSPGGGLRSDLAAVSYTISKQFVTFLMFNGGSTPHGDPDHIWFAVAGFQWGWEAVAGQDAEGGWSLTSSNGGWCVPIDSGGLGLLPKWFGTLSADVPIR
jgi:hypothetical protein